MISNRSSHGSLSSLPSLGVESALEKLLKRLYADAGYDRYICRRDLSQGSHHGKVRWVEERTTN